MGNKRVAWGTYDCTAVTTGELETGLTLVENINIIENAAAVQTGGSPIVDETLPLSGLVTIVTVSGSAGYWFAIGR